MAGPLQLHFDVWPAQTPKGAVLGELTQARDKEIIDVVTDGIGSGKFIINEHDFQAAWCATGNLVRARLEEVGTNTGPWAWDDPRYFHAFYLEDVDEDLLSPEEQAGDDRAFGGRGILSVGERLVWWKESFFGQNFLVRPKRGYWRFPEGDELGHLIQKSLSEWAARSPNPIPGTIDRDFTGVNDSAGNPWPTFDDGAYKVTFGTTYLQSWLDLVTQGIEIAMSPAFVMSGWGEDGRGTDRTATIAFRGGWNIRDSTSRERHVPRRSSRALVKGDSEDEATYVEATYGGTAADEAGKWGRREMYVEYERSSRTAVLQRAGARALRKAKRWDDGPPTIGVTSYGGGSDGAVPPAVRGLVPYTDYFPGDRVSLDIDGDYDNLAVRIVELAIVDGDNGEAEVSLTFDDEPFSASGGSTAASAGGGGGGCSCGAHTHPPNPELCEIGAGGIPCHDLVAADLSDEEAVNGDAEDTGGGQWSGGSYLTSLRHGGARSYGATGTTALDVEYDFGTQPFLAGYRYVFDIWRRQIEDHDETTITAGVDGVDEASELYAGVPGSDPVDLWDEEEAGADGGTWNRGRVCWVPSADRTGVRLRVQASAFFSGTIAVDDLAVYRVPLGNPDLIGTSIRASRCDHRHHLISTAAPTATDDAAAGLPVGTLWTQVDDLDAPTESFGTWVLVDSTAGAAVWLQIASAAEPTIDHSELTGLDELGAHPQYLLNTLGGLGPVNVISSSSAEPNVDLAIASVADMTMDDDPAVTFSNITPGARVEWAVLFRQDGTGGRTPSLPASVVWIGGAAPTWQTDPDTADWVEFLTIDGGDVIFAQHGGGSSVTALDDLSDVVITSPALYERLRFDGTSWRNSDRIWRPMVAADGTIILGSSGQAVMSEGPP